MQNGKPTNQNERGALVEQQADAGQHSCSGPMANWEAIGLFVTALLTICGWLYTHHRNRQLQRKTAAIALLSENRFNEHWVQALRSTFKILHTDRTYDWPGLVKRRYSGKPLSEADETIYQHAITLLNQLEMLSICVLNKAADEQFIRWSQEHIFCSASKGLAGFIAEVRHCNNNDGIYVNYLAVVDRWSKKASAAKPTD